MSGLKKYVIEKEGYSSIIVNLTEREARVIEKFLDWACLDDNFYIESVEEYKADEWGAMELIDKNQAIGIVRDKCKR